MPQIQKGKLANGRDKLSKCKTAEDNAESVVCSLRYLVFVFITV